MSKVLSLVAPKTSFRSDLDPSKLSHDPDVGRDYVTDPLVHLRATARFYQELQKAIAGAHERAGEIELPLLVLQGGNDALVDPDASRSFVERLGGRDCRFQHYPGLYHETFMEPPADRERVFADLEHWLDEHLATRPAADTTTS